jgi:hypothetical protein
VVLQIPPITENPVIPHLDSGVDPDEVLTDHISLLELFKENRKSLRNILV